MAWALIGFEYEFLFAYVMFAGFAAVFPALDVGRTPGSGLARWLAYPPQKALALLQFEADKYWRGLTLLWGGAAAVGLATLGSYVISGPPAIWSEVLSPAALHQVTEARTWIALSLVGAFVPGIVWIVGTVIVHVNKVHKAIENLSFTDGGWKGD